MRVTVGPEGYTVEWRRGCVDDVWGGLTFRGRLPVQERVVCAGAFQALQCCKPAALKRATVDNSTPLKRGKPNRLVLPSTCSHVRAVEVFVVWGGLDESVTVSVTLHLRVPEGEGV
jgi:hypothetical protein